MKTTQWLIGLAMLATAIPAQAHGEAEKVDFTYFAAELQTREGRIGLLERLDAFARRECQPSTPLVSRIRRQCREDITRQVLEAIGDRQLAATAEVRQRHG